ncbi:MAG: hypothetical protein NZ518_09250, partial [Dehalococcoidia bacterium]|nr:hypothetical protein [Dehalococcoidia bacterium]
MTPDDLAAAVERLVRRYSRRYERPHAVVEAEAAFIEDMRALGLTVQVAARVAGQPYQRRYDVLPIGLTIEG